MKITFVRHTSVDVKPGICYGRTDVALNQTFEEEASKVKDSLEKKRTTESGDFDTVFRSPLSRCRLLAEECGYPDAIPDERIIEMNFGEWEMKDYNEIKDPRLQQWFDDWLNVAPPGGESFRDQNKRVKAFLDEMKTSGKENILVFTHAGVMMNIMLLLGLSDIETLFSKQPPYGSLLEIEL